MKKVLKASAGTGKTYRLSLEYVAALLRGQSFEEIVVMTFTRKATAEIRERIIEQIEDILQNGEESNIFQSLRGVYKGINLNLPALQHIYREMLKNKDRINIYTIDSFINRIFKQAIAPYLGIYRYEIIEDERNREVIEEVFKRILDNPDDFSLLERFFTDNTERKIDKYLKLIGNMLNNRWKFLLIEHRARARRPVGNLVALLDECIDTLRVVVAEKGQAFSEEFFTTRFRSFIPDYLEEKDPAARQDIIIKNRNHFFNDTFWNGNKIRGRALAPLREELAARYENFLEQLAAYIYNEEMIPYEEEIFNFSSRVFEIYDSIKFRERVFTHTDLSNYTYRYFYHDELDLLEGRTVSDYFFELLGTEVKSLYIDEFQDTSILQWKILKPLIDRCENVIAVGDEKQSIYGWRGGEKELFTALDGILEGECESLLTCYRSEREIMDFINRFFLNLEIDWGYEEVNHVHHKDGGYVEVLLGGEGARINTETNKFNSLSQERQMELIAINERLTGNLKREIALRIKELPSYSNIGVLARANNDLAEIAIELDKEGIPYILESKDSLFEHEAVKPLYFLLNYLAYRDYFQLLKYLRSDLVRANNRVLKYLLRNKDRVQGFMSGIQDRLDLGDVQGVLTEIKMLFDLDYRQLTNYLLEETGIMELYRDNSGALKNLYHFFRLMRRFSDLSDFMKYIEENYESEELKQVGVREKNAVKLMSIHKAKGLSFETEFFYWNPGSGNGGRSGKMEMYISFDDHFQEVTNYLLTDSKYEKIFKILGINFAEEKAEKELMEELNNVYVALTRAEKNLFFFIEAPRKLETNSEGRCWSGSASYGFYEEAVLRAAGVSTLCDLIEGKRLGELQVSEQEETGKRIDLPELAPYFRPAEIPPEIIEEANNKKDFRMSLEKEIIRIEGLAIHYYLEHVKYGTEEERRLGRNMVLARYGNILGPVRTEEIIKRVEGFIEGNPRYFDHKWRVFNEYVIKGEDKEYRIDRLLIDEDSKEIVILDYKSGQTREDTQLENYKEIMMNMTRGEYKIETHFVDI